MMIMKVSRMVLLSVILVTRLWFATAQASQLESSAKEETLIVTVPFFALDKHGNPITIDETALSIMDDKEPRSILAVKGTAELPLRLGVLIDTSSSETRSGLHDPAARAASSFLNQVLKKPEDKLFFVTFATTVDGTPFMDRDEFQRFRIDLHGGGGTSLFDAICFASQERVQKDPVNPARRVLVIISDGGDNQSRVNHEQAIAAAQKAGVVIFAVSTSENANGNRESRTLELLADKTGGHAFLHLRKKDMPDVFSSISDQIEHMNAVSFSPPHPGNPAQFHSVVLTLGGDKKVKLRTPNGYYTSEAIQ